jgi:hypothetical protein
MTSAGWPILTYVPTIQRHTEHMREETMVG